MKKAISFTLAALAASLSVGCASVAVTQKNLEQNTSLALGLEIDEFTISDRVNEGVKTTYRVKTNSGRKFSCYVTGAVSLIGSAVSDAMCTEMGTPQAATQTNSSKTSTSKGKSSSGSCNELLKAAGRCS